MTKPGALPSGVVLIGMAGSGKTTVGRLVADLMGADFVDTDESVARAARASVAEVFASEGEEAFRIREVAALGEACSRAALTVVATGGGVVTTEAGRRALARLAQGGWAVVWLRAEVADLVARVGDGAARPLLADGPAEALARLLGERESAYRSCATHVVETSSRPVGEVVRAVLAGLRIEMDPSVGSAPDTMV